MKREMGVWPICGMIFGLGLAGMFVIGGVGALIFASVLVFFGGILSLAVLNEPGARKK